MSNVVLRLRTGLNACFSEEHLTIEVTQREGTCTAVVKHARARPAPEAGSPAHEVPESLVTSLIEDIKRIVARPEQGAGGRSTTKYYASVEAGTSGLPSIHTSSSAMPREYLEEFVSDPKMNPESRAKAGALLAEGYYVWAHELYAVALRFENELARSDA